jgi:hypothetical protein
MPRACGLSSCLLGCTEASPPSKRAMSSLPLNYCGKPIRRIRILNRGSVLIWSSRGSKAGSSNMLGPFSAGTIQDLLHDPVTVVFLVRDRQLLQVRLSR